MASLHSAGARMIMIAGASDIPAHSLNSRANTQYIHEGCDALDILNRVHDVSESYEREC